MTKKRYQVVCTECGPIESDTTDDGLYPRHEAHRRAGFHEGAVEHQVTVEVREEIEEYLCPVCNYLCIGDEERYEHAFQEPGVETGDFLRV